MNVATTTIQAYLLIAILLVAAPLARAEQDYGSKYFEPTAQVVTPHIPWASSYEQGPIRVLFITYRQGMREVVELRQRLEMDAEVFVLNKPNQLVEPSSNIHIVGDNRDDAIGRLDDKLAEDYDLIVLGYVLWDELPLAARAKILKKVKDGAGLVGNVLLDDAPYFRRALGERLDVESSSWLGAFPYDTLPAFAEHANVQAFVDATLHFHQFGDGRIVLFKGISPPGRQMLTPGPARFDLELNTLDYDYYLNLAIRAMLYAARKQPTVIIDGGAARMHRDKMQPVTFALRGSSTDCDTRFILRDRNNNTLVERSGRTAVTGETALRFDLPSVPAGSYFADLWLRRDGKVIAFGSTSVRVDADTRINAIEFAQASFGRGQGIAGNIRINVPADGQTLRLRQYDGVRGLMSEVIMPVNGRSVAFEVPPHQPLSIVQRLEAALMVDGEAIDVQRRRFLINDLYPSSDRFQYYIFEPLYSKSFLNVALCREMRRMGFDGNSYAAYYDRKLNHIASMMARANMRTVPELYNHSEPHHVEMGHGGRVAEGEHGPVRDRCLSDPRFAQDARSLYTQEAQRLRHFSSYEFNLGDECAFLRAGQATDVCFSPTCLARFQQFLEQTYETLDVLNAACGTSFTDWSQVIPPRRTETMASPQLRSLWVDHRRVMERVYAETYSRARQVIREVVPEAQVGYDGSGSQTSSFSAEDYWRLNQSMTLNAPYPARWFTHFVRDFAPPNSRTGAGIIGAYPDIGRAARNPAYLAYWPWFSLFQGTNSVWIYEGTGGRYGGIYAVIAPDFSPYDYFDQCNQQVRRIRQGVDALLLGSQREDDGIAVLYSAASNHIGSLTEGFPSLGLTLKAIPGLLEESGFQFRMFSYEQLVDGQLDPKRHRLLIMPYCQAISPQQAEQIKRFVAGGGVVLADLRPAVTDEHGNPYETSPLDEVFGVKQDTISPRPATSRVSITQPIGSFEHRLAATTLDGSLRVSAGRALAEAGDIPAVIVNKYGEGNAVLLNFSLANYGEVEGQWVSKLLRIFFKNLLSTFGIDRAIVPKPYVRGVNAYRFRDGQNQYVGLLRDLPAFMYGANLAEIDPDAIPSRDPQSITFHWEQPCHVYASLSGEYFGETGEITRTIIAGEPHMLALLPYRVESLAVDMPRSVRQGESLPWSAQIKAGDGVAVGRHVLRAHLVDPQGRVIEPMAASVDAPGGRVERAIPIALDQAVGAWTILVRDVATGMETSRRVEVTPR